MKRVVIITGVAGGIGHATAKVFTNAGWYVIGVGRRNIPNLPGIDRYIRADVSQNQDVVKMLRSVSQQEKRIDALINNAAIQICKPLLKTTPKDWNLVMSNNLRSVFFCVKYAYPLLGKTKGSIVNVGSIHAIATSKNIAAYAASKGALLALTRSMALEFGEDGVRVNAILPGAIDTKMLHVGLKRGHVKGKTIETLLRGLGSKHILGRVGRPKEIGQAILFLADNDQSSFMTGQALVVDGGATARLSTE